MLAFLELLCEALVARDAEEVRRLLEHPLARALPRHVRNEARTIADGGTLTFVAPVHALRLYHQTAHLLGARTDSMAGTTSLERTTEEDGRDSGQIELALDRVPAYQAPEFRMSA